MDAVITDDVREKGTALLKQGKAAEAIPLLSEAGGKKSKRRSDLAAFRRGVFGPEHARFP